MADIIQFRDYGPAKVHMIRPMRFAGRNVVVRTRVPITVRHDCPRCGEIDAPNETGTCMTCGTQRVPR